MRQSEAGGHRLSIAVAASALVAAIAILRREPPPPKPLDTPPSQFSAARAGEVLRRLVGDGAPHPVGSDANARMRSRVIDELIRLGYEPSVQKAFVCGRSGVCAMVQNVLTRQPGAASGRAVMLSAHYDSVGAGPGASDDGMGVAALLEIARIIRREALHRNPVIFLIDDGEEAGLLGAEAFVWQHPWANEIGAVVNLENRGTSGPSFLFETSDENGWLVDLASRSIPRPAASSLFYTVYKRLPNDTDLTVFREGGMAGVNFAAIGDEPRYHTPLDDFENASASTLQHHGDNALAMARALAGADLSARPRGNAVFFDVFATGVLRWPEGASPAIAATTLVLLALGVFLRQRAGSLSAGALVWGLAGGLAMPLLAAAAGLGISRFLTAAGALPVAWIAHPTWLLCADWAVGLLSACLVATVTGRRAGPDGLWSGVWTWFALAALFLAIAAPGLSFLFLVPAACAALLGLIPQKFAMGRSAATVAPACVAAFFWLPTAWLLYAALGRASGVIIAAGVGLWAATVSPTFVLVSASGRRAVLCCLGAVALIAIAGGTRARPFSPSVPERMSISWHEDADSGRARWLLLPESNRLSETTREAARCSRESVSPYPWSGASRAFAAAAPRPDLPAPQLVVREDSRTSSRRRLRVTLRSPRGAPTIFLAWPPSEPLAVAMEGRPVGPMDARGLASRGGWNVISCQTLPQEGIDVEIVRTRGGGTIEFFLGDQSRGLPAGGERLVQARGAAAVPSQSGDSTIVTRRVRL